MTEQLNLFDLIENDLEEVNLSDRQKATYRLIYENMLLGRTTSQREVVNNYPCELFKDGYVWNNNSKVHDHCSAIWSDINKINADWSVPKIIVWDSDYNYRLAESAREVKEFCKNLYWDKAMAKLWRYGNLMRKANRDGECKNLFKNELEAKDFWQSFFNDHLDELVKKSLEEQN